MTPRRWLFTMVILLPAACPAWYGMSSSANVANPASVAPRGNVPRQFMGAGSCAAAACHNGSAVPGNEHTLWITRDRHAKAYETLFEDRSKVIQKNLNRATPAHEDRQCLKCHVAPDIEPSVEKKAPYFRTDGVSCESCHGAAQDWLNLHHLPAWKAMTLEDKKDHGLRDTQSIKGRTQVCVTCHVGAPGMDVDHDLIAAGHPRLAFEFTAFHAFMPRHWPDGKDRDPRQSPRGRTDFEARAWVLGQLVTAHAALDLLADRAGDRKNPWPEFAHHDCVACHHELRSPSVRPQRPGKPGAVAWSDWDLSMAPHALQASQADANMLAGLQKELAKGWHDRAGISRSAKTAAQQLQIVIDSFESKNIDLSADFVRGIMANNASKPIGDRATQVALAVAALHPAQRDRNLPYRSALEAFSRKVEMPPAHDPEAIRNRIKDLRTRKEF